MGAAISKACCQERTDPRPDTTNVRVEISSAEGMSVREKSEVLKGEKKKAYVKDRQLKKVDIEDGEADANSGTEPEPELAQATKSGAYMKDKRAKTLAGMKEPVPDEETAPDETQLADAKVDTTPELESEQAPKSGSYTKTKRAKTLAAMKETVPEEDEEEEAQDKTEQDNGKVDVAPSDELQPESNETTKAGSYMKDKKARTQVALKPIPDEEESEEKTEQANADAETNPNGEGQAEAAEGQPADTETTKAGSYMKDKKAKTQAALQSGQDGEAAPSGEGEQATKSGGYMKERRAKTAALKEPDPGPDDEDEESEDGATAPSAAEKPKKVSAAPVMTYVPEKQGSSDAVGVTEDPYLTEVNEEDKQRAHVTKVTLSDNRDEKQVGDNHLQNYLTKQDKDDTTRNAIKASMHKDRVCQIMDISEMDMIVDTMDCFKFTAGQIVVKQGDQGTYFFVTEVGDLEVTMDNKPVNTLHAGDSFGGLALLHKCPRTATVTAKGDVTLWGAPGQAFQKALEDYSEKHSKENRDALNQIKIFNALSEHLKDQVASALFSEIVEKGGRVVTEGEISTAMYFVKTGNVGVYQGGTIDDAGVLTGGTEVRKLGPGDYFGERAILSNDVRTRTIVALERSELFCIAGEQIKAVLGMDIRSCVDRQVNQTGLRRSPMFSQLTAAQQVPFLQCFSMTDYQAGQVIDEEPYVFISCIEGSFSLEVGDSKQELAENEYSEIEWVKSLDSHDGQEEVYLKAVRKSGKKTIGASGARVGVLTEDGLVKAMQMLGLSNIRYTDFQKAADILPKLCLVSKVPIFRNLNQNQLGLVADALHIRKYKKGDLVVKKGDIGTAFFIVQTGHLNVERDGKKALVTLSRHDFFGERALILEEPRNADVEVASEEAILDYVEKSDIAGIITERLAADLNHRLAMEDNSMELNQLRPIRVIGHGDWGAVRLVECVYSGVLFSLKRICKRDGKLSTDAKREYTLLKDVHHPFIVHVVKTFETAKSIYIMSEVITGGSFRSALLKKGRALNQTDTRFYAGCLALVLEKLYEEKIMHRDLKPENILLDLQGFPKVIDFQHAKKIRSAYSRSFTLFGTPHYMAPEVIKGRGYGLECDLWSFGVIIYEMMNNRLPFGHEESDPVKIWEEVMKANVVLPETVVGAPAVTLIKGLLTVDPKRRLGSGATGLGEVKDCDFFKTGSDIDAALFEGLIGRDVHPPLEPHSLMDRLKNMMKTKASYSQAKKSKKVVDLLLSKDEEKLSDEDEFAPRDMPPSPRPSS